MRDITGRYNPHANFHVNANDIRRANNVAMKLEAQLPQNLRSQSRERVANRTRCASFAREYGMVDTSSYEQRGVPKHSQARALSRNGSQNSFGSTDQC